MSLFVDAFTSVRDFFEAGGWVLYLIFFATVLMWTLIIERLWYFYLVLPGEIGTVKNEWEERSERRSWYANRIRERLISTVSVDASRSINLIKALMAVLPLLGLLGTVTGMINVFDVMSFTGTGNARAMAGGVYKATLPTMSGLVAALSGLYPTTYLDRKATIEAERVEDLLGHR